MAVTVDASCYYTSLPATKSTTSSMMVLLVAEEDILHLECHFPASQLNSITSDRRNRNNVTMILQSLPTPSMLDTIAKPEEGDRLNSISSLSTEATAESSLEGDEEDETSAASSDDEEEERIPQPGRSQCAVIREEEEEVCTEDCVVVVNGTFEVQENEILLPQTAMPRSSSLKPVRETIPLRNAGWKNLPKLTIPVQKTWQKNPAAKPKKETRTVQFGTVEIRSYDLCIGDNPSVSYGTPVSLDWTYETICPAGDVSIDVYESSKPRQRRNLRQMMMNSYHRRHILQLHWSASEADCVAAERAVNRLRQQRGLTKALLPLAPLEDGLSSAWRKLQRAAGRARP
jgi:hypothetical protein